MGTTLTGTTPQDTYDSLIKVTDNGPLSGTAKYLSDGLGNDSALALSTSAVGVGNTAPAYKLDVTGDIRTNVASGNGSLYINNSSLTSKFWTFIPETAAGETNLLFFYGGTGAGTKMTLTNGGNVGIGTSAPSQKLEVSNGAAQFNGGNVDGTLGDAIFFSNSSFSTVQKNRIRSSISAGTLGNLLHLETGNGTVGAYNDNQLVLRGDGNVGIGQAAPAVKLDVVGNIRSSTGILFGSDTAAANLLDDYEEGTFTATITPSNSGTITSGASFNAWSYTKIGRQVTINGVFVINSVSSPVGSQLRIGGFPFTIANSLSAYGAASSMYADASASYAKTSPPTWHVVNTTELLIEYDASTVAASDEIYVTATYFV